MMRQDTEVHSVNKHAGGTCLPMPDNRLSAASVTDMSHVTERVGKGAPFRVALHREPGNSFKKIGGYRTEASAFGYGLHFLGVVITGLVEVRTILRDVPLFPDPVKDWQAVTCLMWSPLPPRSRVWMASMT